jgi:hypothetical protein
MTVFNKFLVIRYKLINYTLNLKLSWTMNSDEEDDIVSPEKLPIYQKGKEIFDLIKRITDLIRENNEYLMDIKGCMLSDAALLTVKIAGAEAAGLYDLKMENAAIIRKAARDLMVQQHSLESFGFEYVEYYQMVRDVIDEYRLLFIDWVASFDKWDYIIDRWGLFNPPGVGPFDKDPDDNIPFLGYDEDPEE